MAAVVVHLAAPDGATFNLTVQLPVVRTALVRVAAVTAVCVQGTCVWTAGGWVTQS